MNSLFRIIVRQTKTNNSMFNNANLKSTHFKDKIRKYLLYQNFSKNIYHLFAPTLG